MIPASTLDQMTRTVLICGPSYAEPVWPTPVSADCLMGAVCVPPPAGGTERGDLLHDVIVVDPGHRFTAEAHG